MASKTAQLIPSTGVLVAAIAAAILAAILVNIYIGYAESAYEAGAITVLQLREDVEKGAPILDRHIQIRKIPKVLQDAFERAVKANEKDGVVVGKRAPRKLHKGQILFYADFIREAGDELAINPPKGFEVVTIPISADNTLGRQLQPGGYVTVYGDFDFDPDPKKEDVQIKAVLTNVQVRGIGGSADVTDKSRSYDNIQLVVKQSQVRQLLQIQKLLRARRFTVTVSHRAEGAVAADPEINKEVLSLIEKSVLPGGMALPPP